MTIQAEKIKIVSGQPKFKPTVLAWPQSIGSVPKPYIENIGGQLFGVDVTANKKYFTPLSYRLKNGPVNQPDDYGFERWDFAAKGVKPADFDLIPTISQIANIRGLAYITGTPVGLYLPHPSDTKMPRLKVSSREVMALDSNAVGLYESRRQTNLEHTIRSLSPGGKYHFEGQAWINFLGKEGWAFEKANTPGVVALGIFNDVQGEGFTWGYSPDLGYLITEGLVHKKIEHMAKQFGLDGQELAEAIEAFKRADIMHETGHILGIKGHRAHERMQGLLRAKFYGMMAEKYKYDKKLARIYKALHKEGLTYAEEHSLSAEILETVTANPFPNRIGIKEILYKKFAREADALELEGLVKDVYIDSRFEDTGILKLYESEPLYKESKPNIKKSSNRGERLDERVAKESAAASESNGKTSLGSRSKATLKVIKGGKEAGDRDKTTNYERNSDRTEAPKDAESDEAEAMPEAA